jgi:hypothetical protein
LQKAHRIVALEKLEAKTSGAPSFRSKVGIAHQLKLDGLGGSLDERGGMRPGREPEAWIAALPWTEHLAPAT